MTTSEVADDWADRWRDFHKPVWVGAGELVVRPPWITELERDPEIEIVIDPGRAFGTGSHATTSLCLSYLLDIARKREESGIEPGLVADLGTGSGVLAIAAAKLGFGPVLACDHEIVSVEATRENAIVNGVGDAIEVERRNLREQPGRSAPLWIANLTRPLLVEVAALMPGIEGEPPRELVLSGLLRSEMEEVADAFREQGYEPASARGERDWAALHLVTDR